MGATARLEDYTVNEIKTLGKVADAIARDMLERVVKQVHPIMRKRSWRVPLVSEFYPKQPNLLGLNINAGQHIQVRLRRHNNESSFLPYESVLGTMLHELCHIVHGPHDEKFYGLLDILQNECEELMLRGGVGIGTSGSTAFFGEGKKLSTCQHNPSDRDMHRLAASAAERRFGVSSILMPPDGRRLGGGDAGKSAPLSPRQAAAAAAERRRLDNIRCRHTQTKANPNDINDATQKKRTKTASSSSSSPSSSSAKIHEPIVLDSDDDDNNENEILSSAGASTNRIYHDLDAEEDEDISNTGNIWSCPFCTFFNATTATKCLMCENVRQDLWLPSSYPPSAKATSSVNSTANASSAPSHSISSKSPFSFSSSSSSSTTSSVPNASNSTARWDCPQCTFINSAKDIECAMCSVRLVIVKGDHWTCPQCRRSNDSNRWMCGTCQFLRSTAQEAIIKT